MMPSLCRDGGGSSTAMDLQLAVPHCRGVGLRDGCCATTRPDGGCVNGDND
jgi:hypothetical protein